MTTNSMKWGLVGVLVVSGVIAGLLWWKLEPRQPNLPTYQYGESISADYQAGGASCEPKALTAIRDGRKAAAERERCSEAAEEHRLKSEDLVQQARAADAAQAQTWLNYDLARMALWGTIGGFLTLIAASLAAYYAREASKASQGSLAAFVAAEDANLVVDFGDGIIMETSDGETTTREYSFRPTITNVGRLSARVHAINHRNGAAWERNPISATLKQDASTKLLAPITVSSLVESFPAYVMYDSPLGPAALHLEMSVATAALLPGRVYALVNSAGIKRGKSE